MTDSHDPFAANPYVPPSDRGDDQQTPAPTEEIRVEATDGPPAPAEPTMTQPATPAAPQPFNEDVEPTQPVELTQPVEPVEPPESAAAAPVSTPVPDDFSHRYAAGSPPPAPSAQTDPFAAPIRDNEPTVALPPFAAPHDSGNGAATPPPKRRGRKIASIAAFAVLAGGAGFGGAWAYDQANDDSGSGGNVVNSLDSENKATQTKAPAGTVQAVAAKVLPSVVQINVKGSEGSGSGTGIIISSDGEILTNNHVIDVANGGGTITVAFNDGTNTKAEVIGADAKTDLAVIKAEGKTGLTRATLGTSADLKVGQEVVAIGSPFGLESTVTQGIISALNRPVSSSDGSGNGESTTFPAVQTDAAINPGNSGGPLVDLDGNVIAINSAIRSGTTTSGDAGSIGLGFAIPIDLAKNVGKQLLAGKPVQHAQIGVEVGNFLSTDGITGIGAEVKEITPGGAAEKAGLKKGDVISAVNGALVPSSEALVASVRGFNPGEKITLTYTRNGKKDEIEVTLGSDGGKTQQSQKPAPSIPTP
ncbi:trypsin-like peptidase domain-containing protein [Aeromicrobium sp. P5_D10]